MCSGGSTWYVGRGAILVSEMLYQCFEKKIGHNCVHKWKIWNFPSLHLPVSIYETYEAYAFALNLGGKLFPRNMFERKLHFF